MARIQVLSMPANPAALGTATLFDSTATGPTATSLGQRNWWRPRGASRIVCSIYASDQAVTLNVDCIVNGSTTWRSVLAAPIVIPAGTLYSLDQLWEGDDMRVTVTNGAVAPTVAEYSGGIVFGDRAIGA